MKRRTDYQTITFTALLSAVIAMPLAGQSVSNPSTAAGTPAAEEEENVIVLSPFEVTTNENEGYTAATTLAGNRLNTELRDIGNAVQVITSQFLKDTGAVNNETLLQYTTNTEVGNVYGNFAGVGDSAQLNETATFLNPNQNTRVRGLTSADNTRDFFISDVPWDGYAVDRVDLQRGPNSILFGQGSPAGIINNSTKPAAFSNSGEVEFRFDGFGTSRVSVDLNRELIPDELAVRVALLRDNQKFKQDPAYQLSERGFGALRWEPGFLKKGSARTIIKANYESGNIKSNRPRTLPPGDYITPWFYTGTYAGSFDRSGPLIPGTESIDPDQVGGQATLGDTRIFQNLNKFTTNGHIAQNDNFWRPDIPIGLTRPSINGGPYGGYINPNWNPWIGNFGQSFGGPIAFYAQDNGGPPTYWQQEPPTTYGINSSGAIDGGVGFQFNRLIGINNYSSYAKAAGLPNAQYGIYKNISLTDPTVFDFYNNLLDGPNKREWQKFNVYNISLAQTFFNDKMGIELTYNAEAYKNGQLSLLTDTRQAIYIDINDHYSDGTQNGTGTYPNNIPFNDGTPNPNLGRPFITDSAQFGNNSYSSERRSRRATAFLTHDFEREGQSGGTLTRLLGRHTFTALWAQDEQNTDNRSWQRYAVLDQAYRDFRALGSSTAFTDNAFAPNHVIYLGPSLLDASTASGAYIPRPESVVTATNGQMMIYDSHWAATGVDPAAPYINTFYPDAAHAGYHDPAYDPENPDATDADGNLLWPNPQLTTQSENPQNYVGWRQIPVVITDSETSQANRDLLTTNARKQRKLTTSKALVWQAHFWNNAIVGTYGIRQDRAQGWSRSLNTNSEPTDEFPEGNNQFGHLNLSPENYALPQDGSDLTETSRSWSAVIHFNQLPFIGEAVDRLPIRVSAFYNDSSNFQPEALRVDIYGEQIPLPHGKTKDYGLLFSTKDGKYTFKVNKYKTEATNANSAGLSNNATGFIGSSQSWGANWANKYEYDLGHGNQASDSIMTYQVNNRPAGAPNPPGYTATYRPGNADYDETNTLYNFGLAAGQTEYSQAQADENAAVAAWRAWQASVDPRFYAAWGIDLDAPFRTTNPQGVSATVPNGFALTEDSVSKGYEFEFSAQPTRNWRFTVNASKTSATRNNIGGVNLASFINAYQEALQGPAGDLRIWWGGAGNETAVYQWYQNIGSEWAQRSLQEGTNVPELREWRLNAITNYDFTEGRFKGFNVGGGVRWQDTIVIGYPPITISDTEITFDIDHPYKGPAETNIDFWVGYGRRLGDKVDWRIQLNVRNVFQGSDLIPITSQPDGSPAGYRIAPPRVWTVTNTFRF